MTKTPFELLKKSFIMESSVRFAVSRPQIIQETFDDEIVIVDLDSGSYYSLGKCGADIWNLAEKHASVAEITAQIAASYNLETAQIASAVEALLQQLQDETLLMPLPATKNADIEYSISGLTLNSSGETFQTPILQKFTDMQELLLLDPIHEVDAAGWPNIKAN